MESYKNARVFSKVTERCEKMGEVSASVMEQAVGFYNNYMNAKLGE